MNVLDRADIDQKYRGGSVRMAATSAAIDRAVLIDVALDTDQWASRQVFKSSTTELNLERWPRALA